MVISPVMALIAAAALLFGSARFTRRRGLASLLGTGAMLSALGLALFLSPAPWRGALLGGEKGDMFLTLASTIGITGLFFIAGLRSDLRESWKMKRLFPAVVGMAAPLGVVIATLYRFLTHSQEVGVFVVLAAGLVSVSFWTSDSISTQNDQSLTPPMELFKAVAIAMTGTMIAATYFFSVFRSLPSASFSGSALAIDIAYEILKIVMLFSFSYFVASRFLARAERRLSEGRLVVAYLMIVEL